MKVQFLAAGLFSFLISEPKSEKSIRPFSVLESHFTYITYLLHLEQYPDSMMQSYRTRPPSYQFQELYYCSEVSAVAVDAGPPLELSEGT